MLIPAFAGLAALSAHAKSLTIDAIPGLSYDTVRFRVAPETPVKLTLKNADTMMHNLVITKPGARLQVVNAAMRLGAAGPEQDYIPESPQVLHATPVLNPDDQYTLQFTSPSQEGVYPYVCTFPGHGFVMYGAMYVTTDPLPPKTDDPHIPETARGKTELDQSDGVYAPSHRARVLREFMPDVGPAAIAVSLPGKENYCWDAGACRLRYAWQGAFVDLSYHKQDGPAKILGDVYYRAKSGFPLRIGNPSATPEVEFHGYRLINSFPEFHYEVDGTDVRELIQLRPDGHGLTRRFTMEAPTETVWFLAQAGEDPVSISASTGSWEASRLKLSPDQAREFSITIKADLE